jgi:hypothetical protein
MRKPFIPITVVAGLSLLLAGCSGEPQRRLVVGQVIFRGQPLDEGIIEFEPLEGQGSKSGAQILNGQYRIPKDKGLLPGRYKVFIVAGDGTSGSGNADPEGGRRPGATPGKERIPPEYNVESTIEKEITASGTNRFDFNIP